MCKTGEEKCKNHEIAKTIKIYKDDVELVGARRGRGRRCRVKGFIGSSSRPVSGNGGAALRVLRVEPVLRRPRLPDRRCGGIGGMGRSWPSRHPHQRGQAAGQSPSGWGDRDGVGVAPGNCKQGGGVGQTTQNGT